MGLGPTDCCKKNSKIKRCCCLFSRVALLAFGLILTTINAAIVTSPHQNEAISLLFTTYHDLRLANITHPNGPPTSIEIIAKDLQEAGAFDVFHNRRLICWTDQILQHIQCMQLNGTHSNTTQNVIIRDLNKPEGIAIDWYTDKIYWTDGETNRIEVATLAGEYRKVLFWTDLDQPRAIALVPSKALMIWSDWGDNPKIECAAMDGNPATRRILVHENIFWPNGLTVDLEKGLIYWVDGNLKFLDVMKLDGTNRRSLVKHIKDIAYPHSVTVSPIHNRLFWTDWKSGSIHTHDLIANVTRELIDTPDVPLDIHVWDERLQPSGNSPCMDRNGNCSHLCLLSNVAKGFICACPTGVKLLSETQCADGPQNILFLVQRTQISHISLDSPDYTSFPLPLDRVKSAIAIDYDPVDNFIYWSDEKLHAIRRAHLDGKHQMDIVTTEIERPDGIVIDWLARNLYWTDAGTDRIEVCRLDGSSRRVIINEGLKEPRAIALSPTYGWIFWSDWNESKPRIERAALDGSQRIILVTKDLGWPNGIALDVPTKRFYWCDAKTDRIEVENMDPFIDGSIRNVIVAGNLPHVFGLSILDDYLYWTDWQRRSIDRANKHTGKDRVTIVDQYPDLMGLKVARLKELKESSPCAQNNGNCSHLCLNRAHDFVCRCPIDYELSVDRKTCMVPSAFLLFSKSNTIGRISIDNDKDNHNEFTIPFKDVRDAHSIDVDVAERLVYWIDKKQRSISRAFINGSRVQRIIESGLMRPEAIAVDWISRNIYWTDLEAKRIEVARTDGSNRHILLWKGIDEPRSLVIDPPNGYMYWVEWPSDSIRRAALDGSELTTVILTTNRPIGLALDLETRCLYWASQSQPSAIETASWDGDNRRVLVNLNDNEPYAVTIYQNFVYWSDWSTGDINKVHKLTGQNQSLVHSKLDFTTSLLVVHDSRQTGTNSCHMNNGGCQHLCLPLPNGRNMTCACPTHFVLAKDHISCFPPKNYVIFSQKNSFGRLLTNTSDTPDAPISVPSKNIRAIEYDPIQHVIYWIEGKSQSIRRSFDNGTKAAQFIGPGSQPFDITIDIIGRLLFYTCPLSNTINVTRLDGAEIGAVAISNLEKPRSIAVHSMKRLLFWTDIGRQQSINCARIDGSEHTILAYNLSTLSAIALDQQMGLLFFAYNQRIDVMDIDGRNRRNLVSTYINQVISLAALQGYCYWLDEKTGIERVTIAGDGRRPELQQRSLQITDIVAVSMPDMKSIKNHVCSLSQSKCSHFCIAEHPEYSNETCSCPMGLMLMEDRQSCGRLPACGPNHFTCAAPIYTPDQNNDNKDCIPFSWRCDGQIDCPDKSDEAGCPTCRHDQFRCQSGECIEQSLVCDGTTHCADGHDEMNCCKRPQDFQCPSNKVCIPIEFLCDGWDNCADRADESEEVCNMQDRQATAVSNKKTTFVSVFLILVLVCLITITNVRRIRMCRNKLVTNSMTEPKDDQSLDPLSPIIQKSIQVAKVHSASNDVLMSTLNSRTTATNSYDRNNITGASSSTTNGSIAYPMNPPPSPEETTRITNHRPYNRQYKKINKPPPPSPCSTDVCTDICDESDDYRCRNARSQPLLCDASHEYRTNVLRNVTGAGSLRHSTAREYYDCVPPPTPRSYNDHQSPESSCSTPSPMRSVST